MKNIEWIRNMTDEELVVRMTNAKWIRNMTDEELAKYLAWVADFETDLSFENYIKCGELREDEAADWYDWLQQEKSNG